MFSTMHLYTHEGSDKIIHIYVCIYMCTYIYTHIHAWGRKKSDMTEQPAPTTIHVQVYIWSFHSVESRSLKSVTKRTSNLH